MWEFKRKLLKTCLLSFLRRKTLKLMQTNQYQEAEKHYQKHVFLVFLILLSIKTLKYMQRTLCLGNKRILRETCIMSVF